MAISPMDICHNKLSASAGRPLLACYICCAHLKRSLKLMQRALKSEEFFSKYIINNDFEESKNLVSLIVSKAYDTDYEYTIEQQYNVEYKEIETNTLEIVKEEIDNVNSEETNMTIADEKHFSEGIEQLDKEDDEVKVKIENEDFSEMNDSKCDMDMSESGIRMKRDVQIVLEKIDMETSCKKLKLNVVPLKVERMMDDDNMNDTKASNAVFKCIPKINFRVMNKTYPNLTVQTNMEVSKSKLMINPKIKHYQANKVTNNFIQPNKFETKHVILQSGQSLTSVCFDNVNSEIFKLNLSKSASTVSRSTSSRGVEGKKSNSFKEGPKAENVILHNQKTFHSKVDYNVENEICKQSLPYSADIVSLNTSLHRSDEGIESNICNLTENTLNRHLHEHIKKKPYKCDLCDFRCSQKSYLKDHVKSKHTMVENYGCYICKYKYASRSALNKHLHKHVDEKSYKCDYINSEKLTLKNCVQRKHTDGNLHRCDLCEYRSSKKSELKIHVQHKHKNVKEFACHICKYKSAIKTNMSMHLRTHTGEKPYQCEFCDYRCSRKDYLKDHVQYKHTMEKNYICHICQYQCVARSKLIGHMRRHTGEKPYACDLCDYKCSLKSMLNAHKRIKHSKKIFSCHICQSEFVKKCNLNQHLLLHNEQKSYICEMCDYKCWSQSEVNSHIMAKHVK